MREVKIGNVTKVIPELFDGLIYYAQGDEDKKRSEKWVRKFEQLNEERRKKHYC